MIEIDIDELRKEFRYDPNTGVIERWIVSREEWKKMSSVTQNGYIDIKIRHRTFKGHRLAWALYYGQWPKLSIDHINCVKDDNRIDNLREVTKSQNAQNQVQKRRPNNGDTSVRRSKYIGVNWNKESKGWCPKIKHDGKVVYLGLYDTEEEAYAVRCAAVLKYYTHSPMHTALEESPVESDFPCTVWSSASTEPTLVCAPNLFNLPEYAHDQYNRD